MNILNLDNEITWFYTHFSNHCYIILLLYIITFVKYLAYQFTRSWLFLSSSLTAYVNLFFSASSSMMKCSTFLFGFCHVFFIRKLFWWHRWHSWCLPRCQKIWGHRCRPLNWEVHNGVYKPYPGSGCSPSRWPPGVDPFRLKI